MTPAAPGSSPLPRWNDTDLPSLLTLDELGPWRYASRFGDANLNGRAYGGQVLGQALMAACRTVGPGRGATMLQFLFLQGTDPAQPVEFEVTPLQDGKRFSSRHVSGRQGDRRVLDANVTFADELAAPAHGAPSSAREDPDELPAVLAVPQAWHESIRRLGGYSAHGKPSLDFRVPELAEQLDPAKAQPRLRFWLKVRKALPAEPHMQAAAFAYLSDWWLNFSSLGVHMRELRGERRLYISSLNHAITFHRPCVADAWLHFDSRSPGAAAGRGLSIAAVHDREGRLVATASQECLMAYA